MRIIFFILFNIIFIINIYSQWNNLGKGFNNPGRCILFDSTTNNLIVGGEFRMADSIVVNHISYWNGSNWDSLGTGAPFGAPVYSLTKFNGNIYASSVFFNPPGNNNWLATWNGVTWDSTSQSVNGPVSNFKEFNGLLYLCGSFTKIGTNNFSLIAKYDGVNYFGLSFPANSYSINDIEFYNGNLVVGGNFIDTITHAEDLEYYDGNSFTSLGGGMQSGSDVISSLTVYNNKLYVGGNFDVNGGNVGDYIMSWDGSQFQSVGGGLDGPVFRMKVYNNNLYVCGVFQHAGAIQVDGFARWDGLNWHSVVPQFTNNGILDFCINNGDIYLTGQFLTIDSISMNYISKYHDVVGINEIASNTNYFIYPTCVNTFLYIESKLEGYNIELFDIYGKSLLIEVEHGFTKKLNMSFLKSGTYFLKIENKNLSYIRKIVKL